jgi:hypothetical protein
MTCTSPSTEMWKSLRGEYRKVCSDSVVTIKSKGQLERLQEINLKMWVIEQATYNACCSRDPRME